MILSRSPFYINVPFPNTFVTNVDFTLTVGTGSVGNINPIQTYEFTKLNPGNGAAKTWLDISPYIRDNYNINSLFISGSSNSILENTQALLCEIEATPIDSLGSNLATITQEHICTDGYGYYREGQNTQPNNKILLSHQNYKADARGFFVVPIRCEDGDADPTVNGVSVGLSYSDNLVDYIKYVVVACFNYSGSIEVAFGGETINIELIEECKYDLKEIQFLNRFGVIESMHFYKASKEAISVDAKDFKNNYTNGTSYNVSVHQKKRINVTSNKTINVETGFLNPYYNTTIEELLQSEYVWINRVPVNVKTNSLELKTRIVNKLISYSIDFEYAYDQINNV